MKLAWHQALASIRVRFTRHLVTTLGIGLGIAFFASVSLASAQPARDAFEVQRLQWLVTTSILMCLVGVTNSMLISVTERYREIGTIKCLGASNVFIVQVFVLEALVLGFIGSLVGAGLGILVMFPFVPVIPSLVARTLLVGTLLGLGMTVLAAILPAIQAARMPAAAALRVDV